MTNERVIPRIKFVDLQAEADERDPDEAPFTDAVGTPHWYLDADEQTLRGAANFRRMVARSEGLEKLASPNEKQEAEYDQLMTDICVYALPTVERGDLEGLNPGQRSALLLGFLVHSRSDSSSGRATKALTEAIKASIGGGSSLDSIGSTGAAAI